MPFDESLANRVRRVVGVMSGITEKKMFGGLAFLQGGKMFCGILNDELMVRVGPDRHREALARAHVRPMDFTGRPMKGYVFVARAGCRTEQAVRRWVQLGLRFLATLTSAPVEKEAGARRKRKGAGRKATVRTPNAPGHTRRVDAAKYQAMKKVLLQVVPAEPPGISQSEMMTAVAKTAPEAAFPGSTYMWWAKCVQLDLEARGVLMREPMKPLRWHRK